MEPHVPLVKFFFIFPFHLASSVSWISETLELTREPSVGREGHACQVSCLPFIPMILQKLASPMPQTWAMKNEPRSWPLLPCHLYLFVLRSRQCNPSPQDPDCSLLPSSTQLPTQRSSPLLWTKPPLAPASSSLLPSPAAASLNKLPQTVLAAFPPLFLSTEINVKNRRINTG